MRGEICVDALAEYIYRACAKWPSPPIRLAELQTEAVQLQVDIAAEPEVVGKAQCIAIKGDRCLDIRHMENGAT